MHTLFISDLHLSDERPKKIQLFKTLLANIDDEVDALYILGDLFEFWHGDNDDTEACQVISQSLKELSERGTKLFLMRGNRDFLLGKDFETKTGAQLLDDPTVIDIYGHKTLLMHGDLLCTDDHSYQRFRKITSNSFLQKLFLLTPLSFRKNIASRIRTLSKDKVKNKKNKTMDVTEVTVLDYMKKYDVLDLIHGHTHRRAEHLFKLEGMDARRIVLGDWYSEDSILVYAADHQEMLRIKDYLRAH